LASGASQFSLPVHSSSDTDVEKPEALFEVEAFVDTGFDGALILPLGSLPDDLEPDTHATWQLADGFELDAEAYLGQVELAGITGVYPVMISLLGEEAIVGRRLTDSFRLILDHGMRVIVEQ
jgi:predicted aspartyl protease